VYEVEPGHGETRDNYLKASNCDTRSSSSRVNKKINNTSKSVSIISKENSRKKIMACNITEFERFCIVI
jgi:hypothetical protein